MSSFSLSVEKKSDSSFIDYVRPRNAVTQQREFRLLPEWFEHAAGALVYSSTINGSKYNRSNEVFKDITDAEKRPVSFERMVREIGGRLTETSDRPDLPYVFAVLDARKQNAWCMPGGKIAVYEGLIKAFQNEIRDFGVGSFTMEEKVAAVLAHEIVHAAARHSSSSAEFGMVLGLILAGLYDIIASIFSDEDGNLSLGLPFIVDLILTQLHSYAFSLIAASKSRANEFEADKYGMVYLQRAGYNPEAAIWVQEFFANQQIKTGVKVLDWGLSFFGSHPDSKERAQVNRETLKQIQNGTLQ